MKNLTHKMRCLNLHRKNLSSPHRVPNPLKGPLSMQAI